MGCTGHLYHPLRMTDGGVGPPIPSATDDGWGVSLNPSVSVIRRRIGPLWIFSKNEKRKSKKKIAFFFYHETDRFFAVSGVQLAQHHRDQFHFRRAAFSSHLKSRVDNILPKPVLHIALDLDGARIVSQVHSPITLSNFSSINLVFIFRCSSSPIHPVFVRRVDSSSLVFSLSSHRHVRSHSL